MHCKLGEHSGCLLKIVSVQVSRAAVHSVAAAPSTRCLKVKSEWKRHMHFIFSICICEFVYMDKGIIIQFAVLQAADRVVKTPEEKWFVLLVEA